MGLVGGDLPMARRGVLRLAGLAAAAGLASAPARAAFVDAPDVVLFCDPALRDPLQRLGQLFRRRTGVDLRVLCAPAPLMAAQLVRNERDDILVSLVEVVQQLAAAKLVRPQPGVGLWRNRLLVARRQPGAAAVGPDRLVATLAGGRLGAPDPSANAIVDTPALLRRLGLQQALAGRLVGEVDTGGVAWLLAHGQVALGLVLSTEARSAGFSTAVTLPDTAYPPVRYQAAFAKHVLSRNASAFMQFLGSDAARASLVSSGLEIEA